MKLTDYVADFLAELGIRYVFGLTGGAVVHLFDSLAKHPDIQPIFTHHEQAATLAAAEYARISNGIGAAIVTTGPGGTNAITGLYSAWLDSIPCIYISGQTRLAHTTKGKSIRQLGPQQIDILSLVDPITKYAVMVDDVKMIKYHLQKAAYIARTGRPGPVWIDLPLDLQWVSIEPESLLEFDPAEVQTVLSSDGSLSESVKQCLGLLSKAERPIVLVGYGVRLAHAENEFIRLTEALRLPFLTTWNASDITATDNGLYIGCPGMFGHRGANLAIQNCDLLISIGSHLSIPLTGTIFRAFARAARVVMVDVDQAELTNQTVHVDFPVNCDAGHFIQEMLKQTNGYSKLPLDPWLNRCSQYKSLRVIPAELQTAGDFVNPYFFIEMLFDELNGGDTVVVDGGGTVAQIAFQSFHLKPGQRLTIDSGLTAMGSGLPRSIGACFARGRGRTICLCGDGSAQLNIQELQTVVHHKLNIKVFIFNNGGYLAIRHTQDGFLDGRYIGSAPEGGLSLPDFQKVFKAYGVKTAMIRNHRTMRRQIRRILNESGPAMCEIMIAGDQQVLPRQGFDRQPNGTYVARPLEDMYPYLDRQQFYENMITEPWTP